MQENLIDLINHRITKCSPERIGPENAFGWEVLATEFKIYYEATVSISNQYLIPKGMLTTYLIEIGLKYLSYISQPERVLLLEKSETEFKSIKITSIINPIIYIVHGNNKTSYYKNTSNKKLYLKEGKNLLINKTSIATPIANLLKDKNNLSQDELLAIFENYTPYPQTHKVLEIFNTINSQLQNQLFNNFKDTACWYLYQDSSFNDEAKTRS